MKTVEKDLLNEFGHVALRKGAVVPDAVYDKAVKIHETREKTQKAADAKTEKTVLAAAPRTDAKDDAKA
jgi:hypothetical protein